VNFLSWSLIRPCTFHILEIDDQNSASFRFMVEHQNDHQAKRGKR
jgi:hypothetical protein